MSLIELSEISPIASGSTRLVYQHPYDDELLIKVLRQPDKYNQLFHRFHQFFQFQFKIRRMRREYIELEKCLSSTKHPLHKHVPQRLDWLNTNIGPAMVVQKLTDAKGQLLPTLKDIAKSKSILEKHIQAVDNFAEKLLAAEDTVVGDMNLGNLIPIPRQSDPEQCRIVIVDGLGDSTFIPIQHISKTANRIGKTQRLDKLYRKPHKAIDKK